MQNGPEVASHVAPSAALATHVDFWVDGSVAQLPALQAVPAPQGAPASASVNGEQLFVWGSQKRPWSRSQLSARGSHVAPDGAGARHV